jgi:phospholipase C
MAPGAARQHLKDGGLGGGEFLKAIDSGALPQVAFYGPQTMAEHPGYTDVLSGDSTSPSHRSSAESPQWALVVIVTTMKRWFGIIAPPKGDRWGPGAALIVSPLARGVCRPHSLRHDFDPALDHWAL